MKLAIGQYEVEIKAHSKWTNRNNKYDVMALLNEISLICDKASREAKQNGYNVLSYRYYI